MREGGGLGWAARAAVNPLHHAHPGLPCLHWTGAPAAHICGAAAALCHGGQWLGIRCQQQCCAVSRWQCSRQLASLLARPSASALHAGRSWSPRTDALLSRSAWQSAACCSSAGRPGWAVKRWMLLAVSGMQHCVHALRMRAWALVEEPGCDQRPPYTQLYAMLNVQAAASCFGTANRAAAAYCGTALNRRYRRQVVLPSALTLA